MLTPHFSTKVLLPRRILLGLLVGGVGLSVAGCGRGTSTLRYRLLVEVNTPEGLATGQSVLESSINAGTAFEYSASGGTFGQAPTVSLGNNQYLFALLVHANDSPTMLDLISNWLRYPERAHVIKGESFLENARAASGTELHGDLRRKDYPMLVTFDDIDDPSTIREVNSEDLPASFGLGYGLRRIRVEIVSGHEPLTEGFEQRFASIAKQDTPFRTKSLGRPRGEDAAGNATCFNFVQRKR